jgi:hypothetical protein
MQCGIMERSENGGTEPVKVRTFLPNEPGKVQVVLDVLLKTVIVSSDNEGGDMRRSGELPMKNRLPKMMDATRPTDRPPQSLHTGGDGNRG